MAWDRFDICLAYYVYAMYFHSGGGSAEYSVYNTLSRLRYEPRAMANTARQHGEASQSLLAHGDDFENARAILASLIRRGRHGWTPRRRTR